DSARRALRDSIRAQVDVSRELDWRRRNREPRRIPLTPELDRSAFKDDQARTLLLRARAARLLQDSTLESYDATTHQRLSVGLGFRALGRNRTLFRTETVTRVRWSRKSGVWIDMKGKRIALPAFASRGKGPDASAEIDDDDDFSPIPYFPGRDALWIGADNGLTRAEVDDRELVHPIALGSEAYYTYATGDSLTLTLTEGRIIRLRELRIAPRRPEWKLSVGSFWFDVESGQLVRAAYRLAVPIDIWAVAKEEAQRDGDTDPDDEVPIWVKPLISPMRASLEAVTIEYGLFGGRFWLPRTQSAEAFAQVSFMRVPVRIEERFKYGDVNGVDTLPAIPARPRSLIDSLFPNDSTPWDSLTREERRRRRDIIAEASRERSRQRDSVRNEDCRTTGTYTRVERRIDGSLTVATRIPCDSTALRNSPGLVGSIYDEGEEIFGIREREELIKSLGFGLQSAWAPQVPIFRYGLELTRYNRVEGLATGLGVRQDFGLGYTGDALLRYGFADKKVTGELSVTRSNGRSTWRLGGYHRLVAATDWGTPLSFGSSFGALMFGVDDGAYYRAGGAELAFESARGGGSGWRLFAERHRGARRETHWSLANAINDVQFQENIVASPGDYFGIALREVRSYGMDPFGWRSQIDIRSEAAFSGSDTAYARWAGDLTISRGLGPVAASLTLGTGTSYGEVPAHRRFFLGGVHTVRGQQLDLTGGDTYWLTRAELGMANVFARPVIFADLGWNGPREDAFTGRPMSGVGAGLSLIDGLIRFDLAKGIYPREKWRFYGYLEARF
ncbi:MAG: ShlB/FhaC/HecB family hemolysin secretion/activation protein, partial [Gemmatimonadaceae bacterium]